VGKFEARPVLRVYLVLLLAAAAALSPGLAAGSDLAYTGLALLLPAALLYTALRPRSPAFDVVLYVMLVVLGPLAVLPAADGLGLGPTAAPAAVVLVSPGYFLLDSALQRLTHRRQVFTETDKERQVTPTLTSLASGALAVIVLAPVTGRLVLLLAGAALLLYLASVLVSVLVSVPRRPFSTDTVLKRVIAGTAGAMYLDLDSRSGRRLYCRVAPADVWLRARPSSFVFNRGTRARLELAFTPALAGECRPPLLISALEPRGLVQINQPLEPLRLHVIPMARYAEWLARKYLEQAEAGVIGARPLEQLRAMKRGIDYRESRVYQPGDPLKDINWKHTMKLRQLIVNTYGESGQPAAVIAANLTVTSAAEADRLAFNLITVALTLAREDVPAALAVYDRHRVVLTTGVIDTLEVLRQTLSLVQQIKPAEFEGRHLEPTDIARIRRNIRQLQPAKSEPARRLLEILNFEHQAVEEVARDHPATLALAAATGRVTPPATIFLVSRLNHDAEAILVATEKLARRKFTIVPVENK
jgi:uncharacterized protein (DUF58 family)